MSIGERIRQMRKEKGWSQDQLAEMIGADGRQISRYETNHNIPSVEIVIKLAQLFDVSTDYILLEDSPRKSLKISDQAFLKRFEEVSALSEQDRSSLFHIMDALVVKSRVKAITSEVA